MLATVVVMLLGLSPSAPTCAQEPDTQIAVLAGEWKGSYTQAAVREYKIDRDGKVAFEEEKLKGQLKRRGPPCSWSSRGTTGSSG